MPKITATLTIMGALMLVTAASASAQDRDCDDFDTQAEVGRTAWPATLGP